jgi:serine/threonine protein kinase
MNAFQAFRLIKQNEEGKRQTVETGRVIHGRYLLQRLIKQTAFCCVYQGMDQRLQRAVAVKSIFPAHSTAYRTAVKMTANFSHQHILGLYDLVIEPEALYVVQEYVDGDQFETLVKAQLSPFEIAEAGWQICLALMYAGSSSRRVCHGDLTPSSLVREPRIKPAGDLTPSSSTTEHQWTIRITNFALPADLAYFEKWSIMGGDGVALLETELPWGQQSEGRKADDTRAVGLLLYQLLTGTQEPPPDGRLRFARGTPPELCETLARAIVRQHPQNINTPEVLYTHLKMLAEALEPAPAPVEESVVRQFSPVGVGRPVASLPFRENERSGRSLSSFSGQLPRVDVTPSDPTVANVPFVPPRQQFSNAQPSNPGKPSPTLIIVLIGLVAFGLFFTIGYFLAHALIH